MNFFRNHIGIELALILYWCAYLSKSDAHIAPYLLVGLLALYFAVVRSRSAFAAETFSKSETRVTNGFAFLLASTVVLANYKMFVGADDGGFLAALASGRFKAYQGIAEALLLWGIGFWLFKEILIGVAGLDGIETDEERLKHPKRIFWICWGLLVAEYALVLFASQYPGIMQVDSAYQMEQIMGVINYNNHHPYYHTQIIHLVIAIGIAIFGDINRAVATYSVFSLVVMASCFMYVVETVYSCTQNRKVSLAIFLFYLLLPLHLVYVIYMVKDVFFGAAVTFLAVASYRLLKSLGNPKWNWMVLIVSALGMSLIRNNGWTALLLVLFLFMLMFGKKQKKMIAVFLMVLLAAFVLKHPVLQALHVPPSPITEALSVPVQQIARVVADHKKLTKEQENLLGKVIDVKRIPRTYKIEISDPLKGLPGRGNRGREYLKKHPVDFIKLYVQLGLKYPHKYIEAWVDLTKSYWNAGYVSRVYSVGSKKYGQRMWCTGISSRANALGIKRTIRSPVIDKILMTALDVLKTSPFLQLFISIGAYVWGMIILLYRALMGKKKEVLFTIVPFLAVLSTLLIATPVTEHRYVYSFFCGFPFLLAIAFVKNPKEGRCEKRITVNGRR